MPAVAVVQGGARAHSVLGRPRAGAVAIRGLIPELKTRLRLRAARNARSMKAEARAVLEAALSAPEEDPGSISA
jgi:plasmid stability protein